MPSDNIKVGDKETLDEKIRAGFARPVGENALMTVPSTSLAISDGIITAQRVEVERDEAKILHRIRVMAQAAGEDWFYRYPVKNNRTGQTDFIEGPSIKCANNVARMYGNCQVDTRVVDTGDSWIIYARFCDYETGFNMTRPFQQRKGQASINAKDGGRQLDIALQIGVSKAIRNIVCNALETFTNFAFDEAKSAIVGKVGEKLDFYRERVIGRLGELRVDVARVEAAIGRPSKDWLAPDVARIIAQLQAIKDGMATIDETWPANNGDAAARPTREQFRNGEAQQQPAQTEAEKSAETVQPFEVVDMVGEAKSYPNPDAALAAYEAALDEAEKQNGEAGLKLIFDNNGGFFTQLEERGLGDQSRELSLGYGKRREAAAAREKAASEADTKPKTEPTSPPRAAKRPAATPQSTPGGGASPQTLPREAAERPAADPASPGSGSGATLFPNGTEPLADVLDRELAAAGDAAAVTEIELRHKDALQKLSHEAWLAHQEKIDQRRAALQGAA